MTTIPRTEPPVIAIVGNPNVGKSVLFNRLTGAYVTVSNYPGTTVEVSRGRAKLGGLDVEVVDTPGMYALRPISEEEAVARRLLLDEHPRLVLHVVDAKNLQRMLPMTLQLLEAGLPVALALNLLDESEELGFHFDVSALSEALAIPVQGTAGAENRGIPELQALLAARLTAEPPPPAAPVTYDPVIEEAAAEIAAIVGDTTALTARATALLLLQGDDEVLALVRERVSAEAETRVRGIIDAAQARFAQPLTMVIALRRQAAANDIIARVVHAPAEVPNPPLEWLSRILMHPLWGLPVLVAVLYFAIYQFVGRFGAGFLVDTLQNRLFGDAQEGIINPWLTRLVQPMPDLWRNLIVGDYGVFTLGITYAVAIVLPIVGLFFFVFSILEDSGYLPRLAMLIDRLFKMIGLNGRAVIPLVLGFGCDTMATMVTRVLETKRERIIATLLLALAVPCAAQSGLFMAMLGAVQPYGLVIYVGILALIFLLTGILSAQLMPGKQAHFYIELPPLRLPRLGNVLTKTYTRLEWYFVEIIPSFLAASVVLWLGSLTWQHGALVFSPHHGLFGLLERGLDPLAALIGLPTTADVLRHPELEFTGGAILLGGFFRRDFGAAGLWHLFQGHLISPAQVLTASVTLTLFLPCVAQFLVMKRERGLGPTLVMTAFILVVAFGVGYLLRLGLQAAHLPLVLDLHQMPAR
jgi:ferrous iron transport protein B